MISPCSAPSNASSSHFSPHPPPIRRAASRSPSPLPGRPRRRLRRRCPCLPLFPLCRAGTVSSSGFQGAGGCQLLQGYQGTRALGPGGQVGLRPPPALRRHLLRLLQDHVPPSRGRGLPLRLVGLLWGRTQVQGQVRGVLAEETEGCHGSCNHCKRGGRHVDFRSSLWKRRGSCWS